MLIDWRAAERPQIPKADILIVGGGAVGLCMAVHLARLGREVVLLEAGGRDITPESQAHFQTARWHTNPLEGLHAGRVRALGGTTHLWAGQLVPLDPIVFEPRPWMGDAAWPIAAADLHEPYEKALDLLGLAARMDDDAIWKRLRLSPPPAGPDIEFFFTRWTPRTNLAAFFADTIAAHPRLRVIVNAPVTAIALGEDGETVTAVIIASSTGAAHAVTARHFVLANGTFEMARLLMLPLADRRPAPWASNPWLGRGFLDHVDATAGMVTPLDRARFHALFDSLFIGGLKYKPRLKLSAAAQRRHATGGIAADFKFRSEFDEELAALKLFARGVLNRSYEHRLLPWSLKQPSRLARLALLAPAMIARYARHRRTYNPGDQGILLRLSAEQKPLSESRLRLTGETDSPSMPSIDVDWRIDGGEIDTMRRFSASISDLLEKNSIARVALDDLLTAGSREFLARIDDANHHMGMVRMATRPADGVVDRDLRVFGTRNLYAAGAACFPASGSANPTLTAIALGLRLADKLARH